MGKLLGEMLKINSAIGPQTVAVGAIAVSRPYPMGRERKALFAISMVSATFDGGDILDIGIVDDSIVAPAATGALAALIAAGSPAVLAHGHIIASTGVSVITIETAASADGAITINGVVFPYNAAPALPGEWSTAAQLIVQINALLPDLLATIPGGTVVMIVSRVAGEQTITVTETVTAIIAADMLTLQAVAYLEVGASQITPGAGNIAVVIDNLATSTGAVVASAALVRGDARYVPVPQAVV